MIFVIFLTKVRLMSDSRGGLNLLRKGEKTGEENEPGRTGKTEANTGETPGAVLSREGSRARTFLEYKIRSPRSRRPCGVHAQDGSPQASRILHNFGRPTPESAFPK